MKKMNNWLVSEFLPIWAKAAMQEENRKLTEENRQLKHQIARLNAYIDGLEAGIKSQRRIIINTAGEAKK